ncbi:MAG TPA: hypothetical protein VKG25_23880 [Bryobacteraceae bacterium]|nr:hypothetical protein [Bryobacteraceae bacterium]
MAYLVDTNIVVDVTRGSITAADYLDGLAAAWSISTISFYFSRLLTPPDNSTPGVAGQVSGIARAAATTAAR